MHAAKYLIGGKPAKGIWIDRTAYWKARRKNPAAKLSDYEEPTSMTFEPLPTMSDLSPTEYRAEMWKICDKIRLNRLKEYGDRACLGVKALKKPGAWRRRTRNKNRTGCACREVRTKKPALPDPAPALHTGSLLRLFAFYKARAEHITAMSP